MHCWRIARRRYADLSGIGGLVSSGRWHQAGHEVIYTATSVALAALEYAVHTGERPADSVLMKIYVPENAVLTIEQRIGGTLPGNWAFVEPQTQQLGSEWLISRDSIALEVPSIIIPLERNLILNPKHPGFIDVNLVETVPFFFDPRIFATGQSKRKRGKTL